MALSGEFIATELTLEYAEPASPSSYVDLSAYVNDDKQSESVGEAETTAHGVTARTYIPGLVENEYSFKLLHNNTNGIATRPQTKLKALFRSRQMTTWRVRIEGTGTGKPETTFKAFVSKMEEEKANDNKVVASSVTLKISGPITETTQA